MINIIFTVALNLNTTTSILTMIERQGFIIMFVNASAMGDFHDLINTTHENDAKSRANAKTGNK